MRIRISCLLLVLGLLVTSVALSDEWRNRVWTHVRTIAEPLLEWGTSTEPRMDGFYTAMVEELPVQQRAERALQMSINQYEGATDYIIEQSPLWREDLERTETLLATVMAAQNSPQIDTRMAAYEVALAMVDLGKTSADVDYLLELMADDPERYAGFALWHLGAIGARGFERERIYPVLVDFAYSGSDATRYHGINGLAIFGGLESIDPLLEIARTEPVISLRERAFCGLASSGTFHLIERHEALPEIFAMLDDPGQPDAVRPFIFQALREISGMYWLPEEREVWAEELREVDLL